MEVLNRAGVTDESMNGLVFGEIWKKTKRELSPEEYRTKIIGEYGICKPGDPKK
jgi:hypothetical protein